MRSSRWAFKIKVCLDCCDEDIQPLEKVEPNGEEFCSTFKPKGRQSLRLKVD
jgi:hypothetical protein